MNLRNLMTSTDERDMMVLELFEAGVLMFRCDPQTGELEVKLTDFGEAMADEVEWMAEKYGAEMNA